MKVMHRNGKKNDAESQEIDKHELKYFESLRVDIQKKLEREGRIFIFGTAAVVFVTVALILSSILVNLQTLIPELTKFGYTTVATFCGVGIVWSIQYINSRIKSHFVESSEKEYIKYAESIMLKILEKNNELYSFINESKDSITTSAEIIRMSIAGQRLHKIRLIPDYFKVGKLEDIIGDWNLLDEPKGFDIKMVTTTRGIMGNSGLDLIKLIKNYFTVNESHLLREKKQFPISKLYLLVPKGDCESNSYEVPDYRFSARLFCLKFLKMVESLKISENSEDSLGFDFYDGKNWASGARISCNIRYKFNDIFPAFHIWSNKRLLTFPSLNYEFQKQAKNFTASCFIIDPDTKGYLSENDSDHRLNAQATIERAENHFNENLFASREPDEVWELNSRGEYTCSKFSAVINSEVTEKFKDFPDHNIKEYKIQISKYELTFETKGDFVNIYTPEKQANMIEHLIQNKISLESLYKYSELVNKILKTNQISNIICRPKEIDELIQHLEILSEINFT